LRATGRLLREARRALQSAYSAAMSAPARDRIYRILHLEDSEPDHEVLVAHLLRGGMNA